MDATGIALAAAGVAAAWLGPGLVAGVRLVRDPLERFVVALAAGRLLFAGVVLIATATGGAELLLPWALAGAVAGALAVARASRARGRARLEPAVWAAAALALLAACVLVGAVVGRSGLAGREPLVFFGRDPTNDPFVYGAIARRLAESGLPLTNPFAGGAPVTGSYVPFAVLAGLASLGVPWLDLLFRTAPFLEAAGVGLGAAALVRALGAPRLAWVLAPVLLLLGGDPSAWLRPLGAAAGREVAALDTWAFFGPYLLAFNPIAAGLQTLFAALLLVRRSAEPGRAGARAVAAGLLVAALFEIKLFLWAPALAGLALAAAVRPPAGAAAPLRLAAGVAAAASLPSLVEKAWWALRVTDGSGGFAFCPGCLPRYLAEATFGGDLSFALFRHFDASRWLDPGWALGTAASVAVVAAVALGARALALPALLRASASGVDAVHRVLLAGSGAGLALAAVVATPPHYLNAAQFAWIATYGLWPWVAIALAGWLRDGRWLPVAAVVALALPGSLDALVRLGWRAPVSLAIDAGEREAAAALAADAAPGDVLLEPSMLLDPDHPSPFPLLAGRPVYLSLLSHALYLPEDVREARFADVATVFSAPDDGAARAALARTGATHLYVPSRLALPYDLPATFLPLATTPSGVLYRVPAPRAAE